MEPYGYKNNTNVLFTILLRHRMRKAKNTTSLAETERLEKLPVILDRRIRIAVVGCGRVSKNHFNSIARCSDDIELVAVCDIDEDTLHSHVNTHKVKGYSSYERLLSSEQLDLVALCTPSGLHPQQTLLAAKFKVSIVTEKPMATKWTDGLRMVRVCDDAAVRLFVVKQNRFNPTLRLLKRAVSEKRFGKINMVVVNVFWSRPQDYYEQGNGWRGTWEFDGGALMNQASHYVDLLEWLAGPVERVHAMVSTTRDIEVEDTGVLNVKWRSGTLGSLSVTMLTYPRNLEGSITILGERGSARIEGVAANRITTWSFQDSRDYDSEAAQTGYDIESVYGDGHLSYYNNVIDVFRGRANPETDGREGLKSLEVLIAAYLSARDGQTVSLPLDY
jgi:UDP-N-acetyl-2-amino-2-deoxyglucuronate dehydrogenase